jgi:hypothetical protein
MPWLSKRAYIMSISVAFARSFWSQGQESHGKLLRGAKEAIMLFAFQG